MYYRARGSVLLALKAQTMRVQGLSEADFCEGKAQGGLHGAFTLRSLQNNLYTPPALRAADFFDGSGAREKMAYLGSSDALLYNLLAACHAADRIFYRQRLHTLQSKNACTTIDAMLLSEAEDACVCFDAKLLEWFVYRVNPLRDSFLHGENYAEPAAASCFPAAFAMLIPDYQADAYEHVGCMQYYDGFFVLRQLLALYHTIWEERCLPVKMAQTGGASAKMRPCLQKVRRLTYVSVYWHLRRAARLGHTGLKIGAAAERMEREAVLFRALTASVEKLFRETLDIVLTLRLTDMWTFLEESGTAPAHAAWMQRYMI